VDEAKVDIQLQTFLLLVMCVKVNLMANFLRSVELKLHLPKPRLIRRQEHV